MAFVPRLTAPEAGNKYYIRIDSGGWSRAIVGKPTYVCNTLANCVGYAYGRFHEIAGRKEMDLFDPINGEDIFENAKNHGLQFGDKPALGAMICWGAGKLHTTADGAGHVAIVEQINADGSIVTSESGWECANIFWTTKRTNADGCWGGKSGGYTFLGFIYQPSHPPDSTPSHCPYLIYLERGTEIYTITGSTVVKTGVVGVSTKYTIVDETTIGKTKYGKLKSGAGWVIVEAAPSASPITRDLKRNDNGEDVKALQRVLIDATYLASGGDDGSFGNQTFGALLGYQCDNKLQMTGICDKATRDKMFG